MSELEHVLQAQVLDQAFETLAQAALDQRPVSGSTHNFYRYPARFSPHFARAAIREFSRPGELVGDPYMGGGTAVVEGIAAGRHVIGNDLNSLATFITKVKTTSLGPDEQRAIRLWATKDVPRLSYRQPLDALLPFIEQQKIKNLTLTRARFIKKAIAGALATISELPSEPSRDFARCALLRVSQWALDGRERHTPLSEFRAKLALTTNEMLESLSAFSAVVQQSGGRATLVNGDAALLDQAPVFREDDLRVALIITSPPYPGVHVLYHRWQVDGRRETPAPYWIAGCSDGKGASYYNFADRRPYALDTYFENSLRTLKTTRRIMRDGGYMVQMVAFNRPEEQLHRYLQNMQAAGFTEASLSSDGRIWRQVPNRKWHARQRGATHSANEVVLVHRAT
jgi:hypothetical protein